MQMFVFLICQRIILEYFCEALDLRENGRGPGKEGKLKAVQGIGWWLDEANLAQISYNITDSEITSLHTVFEEVYIRINMYIFRFDLVNILLQFVKIRDFVMYCSPKQLQSL